MRRASIAFVGLSLLLVTPGCYTIEQVNPSMGQSVWGAPGRAYFIRKRAGSTKVVACDARQTGVVCFDTDDSRPAPPQ